MTHKMSTEQPTGLNDVHDNSVHTQSEINKLHAHKHAVQDTSDLPLYTMCHHHRNNYRKNHNMMLFHFEQQLSN